MYAASMKRITISVSDEVADKAQRAVAAGVAESVSSFFARIAEREPDWALARAAARNLVADAGGITAEDRTWALESLGLSIHPPESATVPHQRELVSA